MTPTPKHLDPSAQEAPPSLLEALTDPRQTLTESLLGIDPTESPTAGSIYRQDDDLFEGVEVEDGDTGDLDDDRFVSVCPDTREWLED